MGNDRDSGETSKYATGCPIMQTPKKRRTALELPSSISSHLSQFAPVLRNDPNARSLRNSLQARQLVRVRW